MTEAVALQRASRFETDTLVELMQAHYEHKQIPFHASRVHAAMFRLLSDETLGMVWLIHAQERLVGYIALTYGYSLAYGGRCAAVDEFYLQESYRDRGLDTEVLGLVEHHCRSSDLRALELESLRGNWKAKEFYERLGYNDQGSYTLVKRLDE
jgi:ribosomal protein S18 acetylase RimI-like enzyme